MIRVYKHEAGSTTCEARVDPAWLRAGSPTIVWVDLDQPTPDDARILSEVFHFHELSIEDAMAAIHHPKIESYGEYLYLILHGIDFNAREHCFQTRDVDFFVGPNYLVTVHPGISRSIGRVGEACSRNAMVLAEGPAALMYRIVDTMVDNYRPEVDQLHDRMDRLENELFDHADPSLGRRILDFKRDIASLRRVVLPQRDVVGRLARREFPLISEALSYRFRDVHDNLVRLADEAIFFQDRISSLLDAHLAAVSNQLNTIMKILALISTIFLPLTVLTGLFGMNVDLPDLPGGPGAEFWWIMGLIAAIGGGMLVLFKTRRWI